MRLREGVRGLVVDDAGWILLVRFDWAGLRPTGGFWANPGGGVERGETRVDALRRELREEVGLTVDALGPEVWTKTALFPMGGWDGQVDHVHLVQVPHFDPCPDLTADQLRDENVHEVRWWSPEEIATSDAVFAPRDLPRLVRELDTHGVPPEPVRITGF
ncbi:NUDIX domain-containing protein [Phycicoccus sp. BSK3Z-2]|uniref:NUDIX domain-containing protein n=1 Tax=Phycicoccus avicenniae TaxID=2828860 RepID=A0A941D4G1_9MICO|nr:NUDIX domain-containing protein [Phycicoccus avicenniae]MBR7741929.1 NUDIX domain-containing protein [Phycicoccus avicenniae]